MIYIYMKRTNIYLYILLLVSVFPVTSCNNMLDQDLKDVQYKGEHDIIKVNIYPNSPVLIADGKAELNFKVHCIYTLQDTLEFPLIEDRIPYDKIKITSSDGQTFKVTEPYRTKTKVDKVTFTATVGNIKSAPVSVKIRQSESLSYKPIVVPIKIYAIYDEKTASNVKNLSVDILQPMIQRLNKVFANQLTNAPSSINSKISFKIVDIVKINKQINKFELKSYIEENLMSGTDKYLTIWLAESFPYDLDPSNCVPQYIIGDKGQLPGLNKLTSVINANEIKEPKASQVGITMTYSSLYLIVQGDPNANRFERIIGLYYGLLNTFNWDEDLELKDGDLDYCEDTYSYISKFFSLEKQTFPFVFNKDEKVYYYYDSMNIMDEKSQALYISTDQIKRIRKVMEVCPFRMMKE